MRPNQLIIKVESGATMVDSFIGQLIKKTETTRQGCIRAEQNYIGSWETSKKKTHLRKTTWTISETFFFFSVTEYFSELFLLCSDLQLNCFLNKTTLDEVMSKFYSLEPI